MKVLQVSCDGLGNGGVQKVIMDITKSLSTKIQFDIVLFTDETRFYDNAFKELGGKIFRIVERCHYNSKLIRMLAKICNSFLLPWRIYTIILENGPYEAIHCHNGIEAGLCNMGAYFAGVPVRISHSHRSDTNYGNIKSKVYTMLLRPFVNLFSNQKIGCSDAACESLFGKGCRHTVIINCVDFEKFNMNNYKNIKRRKFAFVHVGQYCANKNQEFILEVFSRIIKCIPEATLDFVGFGPYKLNLKKLVKKLNLQGKVVFHPHDCDVPRLFAGSSYMIFPSLFEGAPLTVIEAQVMGVYCFASNAVPYNVDLGNIKYLDLELKSQKWAENIIQTINEEKDCHREIINTIKAKYDIKNIAKKYEELYNAKQ